MFDRYFKTKKMVNGSYAYSDMFEQKKINFISQYSTYDFNNLKNIEESKIDVIFHRVQPFDKLYIISQKYYESPEFGWLILYTNKMRNELQLKINQSLKIYFPLERLLELL